MSADSPKIAVAMSGGVDSSVAAALLVQQGYEVIGVMLRLWSEDDCEADNRCCTPDAIAFARHVAAILEIPFYVIDARQVFFDEIVTPWINDYARNLTPNPCLFCNKKIRWQFLLDRASALGANHLATGHYAQIKKDSSGKYILTQAVDRDKDQSYVLHILDQTKLSRTFLPIGGYTKPQVRKMAHEFGLPVAERPDSQDLCFLGNKSYHNFLVSHLPEIHNPGAIIDSQGKKIGEHDGLAFFTIGQRKGIKIAASVPLYVLAKDDQSNSVIVGSIQELGNNGLIAKNVNWISGIMPEQAFRASIKNRYRTDKTQAIVEPKIGGTVRIKFDELIRDITPGQAVVFYQEDICLGGGMIQSSFKG